MSENEWTDEQQEIFTKTVDRYLAHPVCRQCGRELDKGQKALGEIICSDCGKVTVVHFSGFNPLFMEENGLEQIRDITWRTYARSLAMRDYPDWWDYEMNLPRRRENIWTKNSQER